MKGYDIAEHSADLKIIAYGDDRPELFKNALRGMFESVEPRPKNREERQRKIEISPADKDLALVEFLSEALYQSDVNNEAYTDVNFEKFEPNKIIAVLSGFPVKGFREEIKAVTYHGFEIKKRGQGLEAPIIFDI